MIRPTLALIALLVLSGSHSPARAAERMPTPASVLVYGPQHVFWVDPPAGWRQDCDALSRAGVCALFYRQGQSFGSAPVVFYVRATDPDGLGLAHFVDADLAQMRRAWPGVVAKEQPALATHDRRECRVLRLDHAGGPTTSQLVAYLAEETAMVMFVASARTPAALEREAPAFAQLVRSYGWFTGEVHAGH